MEKPRFKRSRSVNLLSALAFVLFFSGFGVLVYQGSEAAGTPEIKSGITNKCLDDKGNLTADNTPAVIYTCNGSAEQQWVISGSNVKIHSKCLDVQGKGTTNGTLVNLYTCNGGANQAWTFANHTIKGVQSGKCLDDPASSTTNGTHLQIYTCNGTNAQLWTPTTYVAPTPTPTPPTPTPTPVQPTPTPTPVTHTPAPVPVPGGGSGGGSSGGGGSGTDSGGGSVPTPATPPDAPANFTATVSGTNAVVELSWLAPASSLGVATYEVDRSLDQTVWDTLSSSITGTTYEDSTVGFSVHYYYRLKAVDTSGNSSDFATTDVATPDFKPNTSAGSTNNYQSDDGALTVTLPAGSLAAAADCSISKLTTGIIVGSGRRLVAGPYQLVCKTSAGETVTDFQKPLSWTFTVKGKLQGLNSPLAYSTNDSGTPVLIKASTFNKTSNTVTFSSATTDQVLVLAAVTPGLPLNAIALVMMAVAILAAISVFILHRRQKVSYDEYLRSKYYNI